MPDLVITRIQFHAIAGEPLADGLLGYVSFELGPMLVSGVMVRRTRDGRLTLSFPKRRDAGGKRRDVMRPVSRRARAEIENAVFSSLGLFDAASTANEQASSRLSHPEANP